MISKRIINERDKAITEAIENNNLSLIKDYCEKYNIFMNYSAGETAIIGGLYKAAMKIDSSKSKYITDEIKVKAEAILASLNMSTEIGGV